MLARAGQAQRAAHVTHLTARLLPAPLRWCSIKLRPPPAPTPPRMLAESPYPIVTPLQRVVYTAGAVAAIFIPPLAERKYLELDEKPCRHVTFQYLMLGVPAVLLLGAEGLHRRRFYNVLPKKASKLRTIGVGVIAAAALMSLPLVVNAPAHFTGGRYLPPFVPDPQLTPVIEAARQDFNTAVSAYFYSCLANPSIEEVLFRLAILRQTMFLMPAPAALLLNSFLFSVSHVLNLALNGHLMADHFSDGDIADARAKSLIHRAASKVAAAFFDVDDLIREPHHFEFTLDATDSENPTFYAFIIISRAQLYINGTKDPATWKVAVRRAGTVRQEGGLEIIRQGPIANEYCEEDQEIVDECFSAAMAQLAKEVDRPAYTAAQEEVLRKYVRDMHDAILETRMNCLLHYVLGGLVIGQAYLSTGVFGLPVFLHMFNNSAMALMEVVRQTLEESEEQLKEKSDALAASATKAAAYYIG